MKTQESKPAAPQAQRMDSPEYQARAHSNLKARLAQPTYMELVEQKRALVAALQDMVVTFQHADTPAARGALVAARAALAAAE